MEYFTLYVLAIVALLYGSWYATAKIHSPTLRVFLRAGVIALFFTPTAIGGHGGGYIGPAFILCFIGIDFAGLLTWCLLPIVVGWFLLFIIMYVWRSLSGGMNR